MSQLELQPTKNITVTQLGANIGAEVNGADLSKDLDNSSFNAIEEALMKHEVIFFRDQHITAEQQVAFGKHFGELAISPFAPPIEGLPKELIVLESKTERPPEGLSTAVWHTDETYRKETPMGTILKAVVLPEVGGDTLFSSMTAAYDGLSDRWQQFISGLEAVHDIKPFRVLFNGESQKQALRQVEDLFPAQTHPVVRIHPVTGKKVLFVNPQFTIKIKGMKDRESNMILDYLFQQAEIPDYHFRLSWKTGTIAFWDNRSMQHYAVQDYFPQHRRMERITVQGNKPFGE